MSRNRLDPRHLVRAVLALRPRFAEELLSWRAALHRRRLRGVTFVAITGSTAKTTTRDLVTAVLAVTGPVKRRRGPRNLIPFNAQVVLGARKTDRYCVVETPTQHPGYIDRSLRFVRPSIGIVTNVGSDHRANFPTADSIAEEKGRLVAALPADGVAILNADDPRVLAMRTLCRGRVVTYGFAADADVRGLDARSSWPDGLSLTVRHGGEEVRVQTELCGTLWAPAVLAALATGLVEGIPLAKAGEAVGRVRPPVARMSVVELEDGVTFVRDDHKAPYLSIGPVLEFLGSARAPRKIAVFGTISDYPGSSRRVYRRVARAAAEVADLVVFTGPRASHALRGRRHPEDAIVAFHSIRAASDYLDGVLRPGDLVLLKGSNAADHLVRILLARTGPVGCWRQRCGKRVSCEKCRLLSRPCGSFATENEVAATPSVEPVGEGERIGAGVPVVVGLGNPGPRYEGSPHNMGDTVVDLLARRLGAEWVERNGAWIAEATTPDGMVCLVRLGTPMNRSGPALVALAARLGFAPADCLLVYDDADLPIGKVRFRVRGSSGGHRGVESIIEEVQSGEIRRVKVGVGRPREALAKGDFLLNPFPAEDRTAVDQACEVAVRKVLEVVAETHTAATVADTR